MMSDASVRNRATGKRLNQFLINLLQGYILIIHIEAGTFDFQTFIFKGNILKLKGDLKVFPKY